jgi:lysophospholipase L1-like esterase
MLRRVLLVLVGLGLGLGAVLAFDGAPRWTLLGLALLSLAAGVLGARFSGAKLASAYGAVAVVLLNTLVLLLVLETVSAVVLFVTTHRRALNLNEVRAGLPYYQQTAWGAAHWREIDAIPNEYAPFVVWEQAPFDGQTVTMRADGTRLTPGADCTAGAFTVFMFGGSTMWGMGAPDAGTIPAYVQRALAGARDEPVCVVNFGVPGYVSTQGVIRLITELQQGNVPDVVIFYDGVNDVLATIQNNGAGAHQNLSEVAAAFEPNTLPRALWNALQESHTYRLVQQVVLSGEEGRDSVRNFEQLADETAAAYLLNTALVARLADEYGFVYGFFWQPVLPLSDKPLTPEEAQFEGGLGEWERLYALTYAEVEPAAADHEHLHYIADAFADVERFLWIDPYHIVPEGNAIIAGIMVETMNLTNQP